MLDVTCEDVYTARARLAPLLPRTPLHNYPRLDQAIGTKVLVKHEDHHAIGSFKARGALNALLARPNQVQGVVAYSTGNHAQGVAYAARQFGLHANIVMPDGVNPSKLAAVEALGATVELFGTTTTEGQGRAREVAESKGWLLVDDFADPDIIAGVGTIALEIFEDFPGIDVLVVPVGGGALAGGCGVVAKALRPATKVVGVSPSSCPATGLSWERGEVVEAECHTMADGLAVSRPDQRTVDLVRRVVDEIVFVDEAGLLEAMRLLLRLTNTLAEPSGAAALAGLLQLGEIGEGDVVGIVVSGANIAPSLLPQLLDPGQTIRP